MFKPYLDNDKWSSRDDQTIKDLIKQYGQSEIYRWGKGIDGKNSKQIMVRWFSFIKPNLLKNFDTESWTRQQDEKLSEAIWRFGWLNWTKVANFVGNKKEDEWEQRWNEMVNVGLEYKQKAGSFTKEEDKILIEFVANQPKVWWKSVVKMLPGRNIIQWKNRWSLWLRNKFKSESQPESQSKSNSKPNLKTEAKRGRKKIVKNEQSKITENPEEEEKVDHNWLVKSELDYQTLPSEESKISSSVKQEQYLENSLSNTNDANDLDTNLPPLNKDWDEQSEKLLIELYQKFGDSWDKFTQIFTNFTEQEIEDKFYSILEWTMDAQSRILGNLVKFENKSKEILLSFLPKVVKMLKASPDDIPLNILSKLGGIDDLNPCPPEQNEGENSKEDIIESLKKRILSDFNVKYEKSTNKRRKYWEDSDSFSE